MPLVHRLLALGKWVVLVTTCGFLIQYLWTVHPDISNDKYASKYAAFVKQQEGVIRQQGGVTMQQEGGVTMQQEGGVTIQQEGVTGQLEGIAGQLEGIAGQQEGVTRQQEGVTRHQKAVSKQAERGRQYLTSNEDHVAKSADNVLVDQIIEKEDAIVEQEAVAMQQAGVTRQQAGVARQQEVVSRQQAGVARQHSGVARQQKVVAMQHKDVAKQAGRGSDEKSDDTETTSTHRMTKVTAGPEVVSQQRDNHDVVRPEIETQDHEPRSELIINTYMRSGSTFLGNLFAVRPDVFFVFEPLWAIQKSSYFHGNRSVCKTFADDCSKPGAAAVQSGVGNVWGIRESLKHIAHLLECSFYKPRSFLHDNINFPNEFSHKLDHWRFYHGVNWKPYMECAQQKKSFIQCLSQTAGVCARTKHKVLKVIRSTLDNLEPLLKERPELKVVQMFRDPRGILNSHLHTAFVINKVRTPRAIQGDMISHCRRILYDVTVARKLMAKYPDRVLVIQYEDFGYDLQEKAKKMYEFLNMAVDDEITKLVNRHIKPAENMAAFHPYKYRDSLPWEYERLIMPHCRPVYESLGYPIFNNEEEYRNTTISDIQHKLKFTM